jgi:vesicle-fusing ATPase
VVPFKRPDSRFVLSAISFTVGDLRKSKAPQPMPVDCKELGDQLVKTFSHQVMRVGQSIAHNYNGLFLELSVTALSTSHSGASDDASPGSTQTLLASANESQFGLFLSSTDVTFKKNAGANLKLTGNKVHKSVNQMVGVNFEELGIGGLNKEFSTIFRRAFASRTYSPGMIEKLGTQHVRGMMLYGPPGCGKTLIARQISRVLQGGGNGEDIREPKVVNG